MCLEGIAIGEVVLMMLAPTIPSSLSPSLPLLQTAPPVYNLAEQSFAPWQRLSALQSHLATIFSCKITSRAPESRANVDYPTVFIDMQYFIHGINGVSTIVVVLVVGQEICICAWTFTKTCAGKSPIQGR